jgi:YidC/Oxa1 family membrane protein insertase
MSTFLKTILYIPLYNALVFIIDHTPGHSAGWAVILLTLIIRVVLFPLSKSSIKTQLMMKKIEPDVAKLKEKVTDKQEQARQMLELYREKGINPFAGFLLILIQFPILIAMYSVFRSGLPTIKPELLYSFVPHPETVTMMFLGINLGARSIILAALSVITQFIQINLALPKVTKTDGPSTFQTDLAKSMNMQMKYIFPLIIAPIAFVSPVLALYFIVGNIFMIFQELYVKRRMAKKLAV